MGTAIALTLVLNISTHFAYFRHMVWPNAAIAVGWALVFGAAFDSGHMVYAAIGLVTALFFARACAAAINSRTTKKGAQR